MSDAVDAVDAVITGRSLPAMLAALTLAEVGLRVVVAGTADGLPTGGECDPEGAIAEFLERIAAPVGGSEADARAGHAEAAPRHRDPLPVQVRDRAGAWAPQSSPAVCGIPAVPLASENLRLLGAGAASRAYLDRLMPLLTIGKTRRVGALVRRRLGRRALERLVEPLVLERFGRPADEVDVALAVPGLNEALSRSGSLTAAALACSERHAERAREVAPVGGWAALATAVRARLTAYGVEIVDAPVTAVRRDADGRWRVSLGDAEARRLVARSLIIDADVSDGGAMLAEAGADRHPEIDTRVYAEIDIHPVEGLDSMSAGVCDVDGWSVRVEARDGTTTATFGCPAGVHSPGVLDDRDAREALIAAAARRLERFGAHPSETAEWTLTLRAAPFATVESRDAVAAWRAAIEDDAADAALLPVGRWLHGDDLSAALGATQRAGVALRRRLLGLTA